MKFQTKQEFFWKGKFGDQYIKRNNAKSLLVAHKKFFKKILIKANKINSIIEFGPNIGINLMVLKKIKLIDYGFVYHQDKYPQDDITWFLLQKK